MYPTNWESNWKKRREGPSSCELLSGNVGYNPHSSCHSSLTFFFKSYKGQPCAVQMLVSPFAQQKKNKEAWGRETFMLGKKSPQPSLDRLILCTRVVLSLILLICVLGEQGQYLSLICVPRFPCRLVIIC